MCCYVGGKHGLWDFEMRGVERMERKNKMNLQSESEEVLR